MNYRDPERSGPSRRGGKFDGQFEQSLFDAVERAEKSAVPESLDQMAWRELQSTVCACGSKKQPKMSFCRDCYYTLSKKMQIALWTPMSKGYAGIYAQCKEFLKQEGRIAR